MLKRAIIVLFLLILGTSCTHTEEGLNSRSFPVHKDKVWEVLVAVLKSYPLKTIDEQSGYIETKRLRSQQFWKAPHQKDQDLTGYSSVITITLNYEEPISTVSIDKKVYKQEGFISREEEIPSDLLEESILLYRVERELSIRSRLSRWH